MKMVIQILSALVLTIGISACNPEYYHEPATIVEPPLLEEFSQAEQLAVKYCIGKHETMPTNVDCSINGETILWKMVINIILLKSHIKEQRIIIEKHNESNESR